MTSSKDVEMGDPLVEVNLVDISRQERDTRRELEEEDKDKDEVDNYGYPYDDNRAYSGAEDKEDADGGVDNNEEDLGGEDGPRWPMILTNHIFDSQ